MNYPKFKVNNILIYSGGPVIIMDIYAIHRQSYDYFYRVRLLGSENIVVLNECYLRKMIHKPKYI